MALARRLTVAMIGLTLLTAVALALLTFRDAKVASQLAGIVVVAGISALAYSRAKPPAQTTKDAAALDSERRRVEAAAEQHAPRERTFLTEETFRLAVEACPSGMVMVNPSGKIAMVNAEVERLFGYGRDELLGQPVDMLLPERLRGDYARVRDGFMHKPETRRLGLRRDLFGQHKGGTEFPVEVGLNPIHLGNDLFILGVIVDISERKRIERLKDEFVSIVSHELRTPLTSIAGSLGLLAGGAAGKLPDPVTRLLTIARTNSQRLVRLINEILDIEKMQAGQIVFQFTRIEARSLVEQAMESNRGFADDYGVQLRLDADSVSGVVHADADRLSQVITNLLSNAIKFSPKGAEVVAAVEQHGNDVRISVRDHGVGIPAQFKPRIFEKFAQADVGETQRKGGSGLGLSIVKQIVTRLGGKVGFKDASGGGTVFHVDLPAWERASSSGHDVDGAASGRCILICQDRREVATELRKGLRQVGFRIDFAHSTDEAVTRAATAQCAAILVDHHFPEGGGIELIRKLREQRSLRQTPMVIMSAEAASAADNSRALHLNILGWLEKPVDINHLVQILGPDIANRPRTLPKILHVDDDHDALDAVAAALCAIAQVVSVDSVEDARRALSANHFDMVVLDIMVGAVSGLDLLPDLRTHKGSNAQVIIFSARGAEMEHHSEVHTSLGKSRASLDRLVGTVQNHLMSGSSRSPREAA